MRAARPAGDCRHRNPLDAMERIVGDRNWLYERLCDTELAVEIAGEWCDYRLFICWQTEARLLLASCSLDMRVPKPKRGQVFELLALINERLAMGHFDLPAEDSLPLYRCALPLRGVVGASVEQLEDLMDLGLVECERYYPAFQYLLWAGKAPRDAVCAAQFEAVGEA